MGKDYVTIRAERKIHRALKKLAADLEFKKGQSVDLNDLVNDALIVFLKKHKRKI